jgi:hypothetical protein
MESICSLHEMKELVLWSRSCEKLIVNSIGQDMSFHVRVLDVTELVRTMIMHMSCIWKISCLSLCQDCLLLTCVS